MVLENFFPFQPICEKFLDFGGFNFGEIWKLNVLAKINVRDNFSKGQIAKINVRETYKFWTRENQCSRKLMILRYMVFLSRGCDHNI